MKPPFPVPPAPSKRPAGTPMSPGCPWGSRAVGSQGTKEVGSGPSPLSEQKVCVGPPHCCPRLRPTSSEPASPRRTQTRQHRPHHTGSTAAVLLATLSSPAGHRARSPWASSFSSAPRRSQGAGGSLRCAKLSPWLCLESPRILPAAGRSQLSFMLLLFFFNLKDKKRSVRVGVGGGFH